jgi:hypothetical protein
MDRAEKERSLINRGFRFVKRVECVGCKFEIEWWKTTRRKLIPLTSVNLEPHWEMCRAAFKNEKPLQTMTAHIKRSHL